MNSTNRLPASPMHRTWQIERNCQQCQANRWKTKADDALYSTCYQKRTNNGEDGGRVKHFAILSALKSRQYRLDDPCVLLR